MALIPEFAAQIVCYNFILQWRIGGIARHILPLCQPPTAWAGSGCIPYSGRLAGFTGASRLIVAANPERVAILDGRTVAATHARCFGLGLQIENLPPHIENPWAMDQRSRNWTERRRS
jgi:hypothetical protein